MLLCFERVDGAFDGVAPGAELFDALGGQRDEGAWVVMLFEACGLAAQRAVDVVEFEAQPCECGVVLAPGLGDCLGEFVAQEPQPVGRGRE